MSADNALSLPTHEDASNEKRTITHSPVRSTAYLDGLRGVAALCVFNQHSTGGIDHHHGFGENGNYYLISFPFLRVFYSGGGAAVAVFFVLSGLVISQNAVSLLRKRQEKKCRAKLLSAAIRRPARLYLPCLAVTFIVAMLMQLPNNVFPSLPWSEPQASVVAELQHWLDITIWFFNPFQHHDWTSTKNQYDLVLWTLPIELKGSYLIYLLVLLSSLTMSKRVPVVLAGLTIALLQFGFWAAGCFTGGLVLTMVQAYYPDLLDSERNHFVSYAAFTCGWYLLSEPVNEGHREWSLDTPGWHTLTSWIPKAYDDDTYYRFWQSYGAMLLIASLSRLQRLQNILETSPLRYLGKISFMLYLFHQPVFLCMTDRLRRVYGNMSLASSMPWDNLLWLPDIGPIGLSLRWVVEYVTALSVNIFVAHLATKYIDGPSVQVAKVCSRKLGVD